MRPERCLIHVSLVVLVALAAASPATAGVSFNTTPAGSRGFYAPCAGEADALPIAAPHVACAKRFQGLRDSLVGGASRRDRRELHGCH
jgi:hypothetical protein